MNQYGYYNYQNAPKGWDHFDGLMDPYTYIYNTPVFSANGERPRFYQGQHQTDVIRAKSVDHLKKLLANPDQPWFLEVAGVAPHQQFNGSGMWPPVAATRHHDLFPGLKAPRTPNFNPPDELHNKPSWVGELPRMDEETIAFSDETYRRRAQSIVGLNEMFHHLLDILEEAGELENTYIITSSDHGYHVGQHRVAAGKLLPYKEDTHVPFIIRGPGIPKGQSTKLPSSHIDIAPTLLTLVGLDEKKWPSFLDGRDLSAYWNGDSEKLTPAPETVNIEFWGGGMIEKSTKMRFDSRNTYKTVRIVGEGYAYLYSHWCTNETELYDTTADPYELTPVPYSVNPRLHNRLVLLQQISQAFLKCNFGEALVERFVALIQRLDKIGHAPIRMQGCPWVAAGVLAAAFGGEEESVEAVVEAWAPANSSAARRLKTVRAPASSSVARRRRR